MTDVTISDIENNVTISETANTITITEPISTVTITDASTYAPSGPGVRTRIAGSSFSGSSGSSGRVYTHTATITSNAIVAIGRNFLDPESDYSLSTTTNTNDTITITNELFDDEVVLLWQ